MNHIRKWQIRLDAEPVLLEKLSREFWDAELRIFRDSTCWFLESVYLNTTEPLEIYEKGEELIGYLNCSLWLHTYRLNPIKSIGYYLMTNSGERIMKFIAIGKITAPTLLIVSSDEIPSRNGFNLFTQNLKVKESLTLFNNAGIDWFTLYKIYETVRDDEPDIPTSKVGRSKIKQWGGENEYDRFYKTANWHRHSAFGKHNEKPNAKPINLMSVNEAQEFMRKVLIAWLQYKLPLN